MTFATSEESKFTVIIYYHRLNLCISTCARNWGLQIIWTRSTTWASKHHSRNQITQRLGLIRRCALTPSLWSIHETLKYLQDSFHFTTFDLFFFYKTWKLPSSIRHQRQLPPEQPFAKPKSFLANSGCGSRNRKTERKKKRDHTKTKTKTESFILCILYNTILRANDWLIHRLNDPLIPLVPFSNIL